MSSLSILFLLAMSSTPSPTEVANDLDTHPWRPAPAAPAAAESTSRIATPMPLQTPKASKDAATAPGVWQLQLGALSSPDAANTEKKRLEKILGSGSIEIFVDGSIHKLRYGKFCSKEEAETATT